MSKDRINVAKYISNLGKSVAYSAVDRFKDRNETIGEFTESNADLFKSIHDSVRNYKLTFNKTQNTFKQSKMYSGAEAVKQSLFEDLRTGKFYNKDEARRSLAASAMGFGDGWDMGDDDFDMDDDFNMDDDWDVDETPKKSSSRSGDNTAMVNAIHSASMESSRATSMSIARTGEYIVESQKTSSQMLYMQNMQTFNMMNGNLKQLNNTVGNLMNFSSEVIQTHAANSTKYYEDSLKLMVEQNTLLKEIAQAVKPTEVKEKKASETVSYGDIVGSTGAPDLKMYGKRIAQNIKNKSGMISAVGSLFGDEGNPLLALAESPLKFVTDQVVNQLIPKSVDKALDSLDKSFSGFFGSLVSKFNSMANDDDNPITKFIGEILGVNDGISTKVNTSNYEKGKVDWDGKSRKALIEVIPGYLAQLVALQSGQDAKIYDYEQGKYVSIKTKKKKADDDYDSNVKRATSDVASRFDEMEKLISFRSELDRKTFKEDQDKLFKFLYDNGEIFDVNNKEKDSFYYGVSDKNYKTLKAMFNSMSRSERLMMNRDIQDTRSRHVAQSKLMGSDDDGLNFLYNDLFSNKDMKMKPKDFNKMSPLLKTVDNRGRNIFYYLQNMYSELYLMRTSGGSGKKRKKAGSGSAQLINADGTITDVLLDQIIPTKKTDEEENEARANARSEANHLRNESYKAKEGELVDYDLDDDELYGALMNRFERDNIKKAAKKVRDEKLNFIDKNLSRSDKKDAERIARLRAKGKNPDDYKMSLFDRLLEAETLTDKANVIFDKVNGLANKPLSMFTNIVDKADQRMYEVIYGTDDGSGKGPKGFMDVMVLELKKTFRNFNDFLDDKILEPLRKKLDVGSLKDIGKKFLKGMGFDVEVMGYKASQKIKGSAVGEGVRNALGQIKGGVGDAYTNAMTDARKLLGMKENPYLFLNNYEYDEVGRPILNSLKPEMSFNKGAGFKALEEASSKGRNIKPPKKDRNVKTNEVQDLYNRQADRRAMGIKIKGPSVNMALGMTKKLNEQVREQALKDERYKNVPLNVRNGEIDKKVGFTNELRDALIEGMKNGERIEDVLAAKIGKLPEHAVGGVIEQDEIASLRQGEVVLTPEQVYSLDGILSKVKEGVKFGNKPSSIASSMANKINRAKSGGNVIQWDFNTDVMDDMNPQQKHMMSEIITSVKANTEGVQEGVNSSKEVIQDAVYDLGKSISMAGKSLFGNFGNKEYESEQANLLSQGIKEVAGGIGDYAPDMISKSLIGAGVSFITGAVGGPLVGAALGAATSLVKNNATLNEALFGKVITESGERAGGLIPRDLINGVGKYLPDFKTYGIAGMVTGLLPLVPFGPLGGLMLGSGLAFAKNNEVVQRTLFGEDGFVSDEAKAKFKKMMPKMGLGAVAGAMLGPFGLMGNMMLGSGLAMVASTDKFKEMIFGKYDERTDQYENGMLPAIRKAVISPLSNFALELKDTSLEFIKKNILDPFKSAIDPIKKELSLAITGTFDKVGNFINGMFENTLGVPLSKFMEEKLLTPMTKLIKGTIKAALFPAKAVALPFKAVGAYGDRLRRKHIKRGQADYMSADERMSYRGEEGVYRLTQPGRDKFGMTDQFLSSLNSNQANEIYKLLEGVSDPYGELKRRLGTSKSALGNELAKDFDIKTIEKVNKLVESGKTDKALSIIDKASNLLPARKAELKSLIVKTTGDMADSVVNRYNKERVQDEMFGKLESLGLKGINKKNAKNFKNLLFTEIGDKKNKEAMLHQFDSNELESIYKTMGDIVDPNARVLSRNKTLAESFRGELSGINNDKLVNKIVNALNDGNMKKVKNLLFSSGLNETEQEALYSKALKIAGGLTDSSSMQNELYDKLNSMGLNVNKYNLDSFKSLTSQAMLNKAASEESLIKENPEIGLQQKNHNEIVDIIVKIKDTLIEKTEANREASENMLSGKHTREDNHMVAREASVNEAQYNKLFANTKPKIGDKTTSFHEGREIQYTLTAEGWETDLSDSSTKAALADMKKDDQTIEDIAASLKTSSSAPENPNEEKRATKSSLFSKIFGGGKSLLGSLLNTAPGKMLLGGAMAITLPGILKKASELPIVQDMTRSLGTFYDESMKPWIQDVAMPAIGNIIGTSLSSIPEIIGNTFSALINVGGGIISGWKDSKIERKARKQAEKDGIDLSQMTDEEVQMYIQQYNSEYGKGITTDTSGIVGDVGRSGLKTILTGGQFGKTSMDFLSKGTSIIGAPKRLFAKTSNLLAKGPNAIYAKTTDKSVEKVKSIIGNKFGLVKEVGTESAEAVAKSGTESIIREAAETFVTKFTEFLNNMLVKTKIGEVIARKISDAIPTIAKKFIDYIQKNIVKLSGTITAKAAGFATTGGLINIAFAAMDFVKGWREADKILGVDKSELNLASRFLAGLTEGVLDLFLITSIVPTEMVFDVIADVIMPIFGISNTNWQEQRRAKESQTGADESLSDYANSLVPGTSSSNTNASKIEEEQEKTKQGFFNTLKNKVKSFFGMGSPDNNSMIPLGYGYGGLTEDEYIKLGISSTKKYSKNTKSNGLGYGIGSPDESKMRLGDKVINYAKAFLGQGVVKYSQPKRHGINSQGDTADCSSFVQHVLTRAAGIDPGSTSHTMKNLPNSVSVNQAQQGDVLWMPGHVGLHTGNNEIIHIGDNKGVRINSLSTYKRAFEGNAKRLFDPNQMVDNVITNPNSAITGITGGVSTTPANGFSGQNNEAVVQEPTKKGIKTFLNDVTTIGTNMANRLFGLDTNSIGTPTFNAITGEIDNIVNGNSESPISKFFTSTLGGKITSGFGRRTLNGATEDHQGIDVGAREGSKIVSPVSGRVAEIFIDKGDGTGAGNGLKIVDSNNYSHVFAHMRNVPKVGVGVDVKAGQELGEVGSTGRSTGNHLHYEIRNSAKNPIDPNKYYKVDPAIKSMFKGDKPVNDSVPTGAGGKGSPSLINQNVLNNVTKPLDDAGVVRTVKNIPIATKPLVDGVTRYKSIFEQAGNEFGVDPYLLMAIANQESGGRENLKGAAWGLMQIEGGGTTKEFINFGKNRPNGPYTSDDRLVPAKAIPFAAHRLANDFGHYSGDYLKTTQAYNFSKYSLDKLIAKFPGDEWISQRQWMGRYNGTGRTGYGAYGDPKYIENVFRYYHGKQIPSDGMGVVSGGSGVAGGEVAEDRKPGLGDMMKDIKIIASNMVNRFFGLETESILGGTPASGVMNETGSYMWAVPNNKAEISGGAKFGPRNLKNPPGASKEHKGIDIGGNGKGKSKNSTDGHPILATAAGKVTKAGSASGYGNLIEIDHGGGMTSRYGHMWDNGMKVRVGDTVAQGQQIGTIGSSGVSSGPHLHFEIRKNGVALDPLGFVSPTGVVSNSVDDGSSDGKNPNGGPSTSDLSHFVTNPMDRRMFRNVDAMSRKKSKSVAEKMSEASMRSELFDVMMNNRLRDDVKPSSDMITSLRTYVNSLDKNSLFKKKIEEDKIYEQGKKLPPVFPGFDGKRNPLLSQVANHVQALFSEENAKTNIAEKLDTRYMTEDEILKAKMSMKKSSNNVKAINELKSPTIKPQVSKQNKAMGGGVEEYHKLVSSPGLKPSTTFKQPYQDTSSGVSSRWIELILAVLNKIANNTSSLSEIVGLLSKVLNVDIPKETQKKLEQSTANTAQITNVIRANMQQTPPNGGDSNAQLLNLLIGLANE